MSLVASVLCTLRLSFNQSVSFMLPKSVCILMRIMSVLFMLWGVLYISVTGIL